MSDQKHGENQRSKSRRAIKIGMVICAVIVVLSIVTATLDPEKLVADWFGQDEQTVDDIYFYPADEGEDIMLREDYLDLDRHMYYTDPMTGETSAVEENEMATIDSYLPFFKTYLDCIVRGDADMYMLCFSSDYIEKHELADHFTMQMLYDMYITPYPNADEDGRTAYLLDYKIYRNNGTFRRDIGSNATRTLLLYLVEEQGSVCIDAIIPYTQY